jgi:AcrR family transcriptional regulator
MQSQGGLSIQRMCEMATVTRASFYRHWEKKAPTEAEMALRDAIQRMAVGHRFYGCPHRGIGGATRGLRSGYQESAPADEGRQSAGGAAEEVR